MNTLFIIGNGFDINLGIQTRYVDFYNYYRNVRSNSDIIYKLKNSISSKDINWSDLELALGEYTVNIRSIEEFDEVFEDIGKELAIYLQKEESKFNFNNVDVEKIYQYLCTPENYLLKADKESITAFVNQWANHVWYIDIVTLNYTRVLEKLLEEKHQSIDIGKHHGKAAITLRGIEHIHGYSDDRMVLGVNDLSQVKNKSLHTNRDIIEALVKIDCNKAQKHTIEKVFQNRIESANLICIFGSSIGDTDKMWWELIGKQLRRDCYLIIFCKCEDIDPRISYKKGRKEREIKKLFLSKTDLKEEERNNYENRIYVGLNSGMFKGILTNQ